MYYTYIHVIHSVYVIHLHLHRHGMERFRFDDFKHEKYVIKYAINDQRLMRKIDGGTLSGSNNHLYCSSEVCTGTKFDTRLPRLPEPDSVLSTIRDRLAKENYL